MLKSVAIKIFQNYFAKQTKFARFPESLYFFYFADANCTVPRVGMMKI